MNSKETRVKLIKDISFERLEREINSWLSENDVEVLDIKYLASPCNTNPDWNDYSTLIIYKK